MCFRELDKEGEIVIFPHIMQIYKVDRSAQLLVVPIGKEKVMDNSKIVQNFIDGFKGEDGVRGNPFSEQLEFNLVTGISKLLDSQAQKKDSAGFIYCQSCRRMDDSEKLYCMSCGKRMSR